MGVRDLTGQKFGRLLVLRLDYIKHTAYWACTCECGKLHTVKSYSLTSGATKSCGCYNLDVLKTGVARRTHGMTGKPTYTSWSQMCARCCNKKHPRYFDWGGRGIKICKRWRKFENFFKDMGSKPIGKFLDRVDNNKGYFKENCRWATLEEQAGNKRNIIKVGDLCLVAYCRKNNLSYGRVCARLHSGETLKAALSPENRCPPLPPITYKNKTQRLQEWCKELKLPYNTVYLRIKQLGWRFSEVVKDLTATQKIL